MKLRKIAPIKHISFVAFIWVLMSSCAVAEVAGPGRVLNTGKAVSLEESKAYYRQPLRRKGLAILEGASSATATTAEITELARALHHDPKLIYDYVYNHIDYAPYFGSLKGATLTLLDGMGNDFDQAALMVALLRASGYTANFVHGTKSVSYTRLAKWLGVESWLPANRSAVLDLAWYVWGAGGGIPASITTDALIVEGVWVKAAIGGVDYLFDPSDKLYSNAAKIDIGSATGYNRTAFLNAAKTGATIGDNFIQNVNQANLNDKLKEYATNLINTLRSRYPNSDIRDIIGGRQIIEAQMTRYSTTLASAQSVLDNWTEIPSAYTAALRIQHQGINHTFDIPEIAGKRLTITYTGTNLNPELRLDGALIDSGNPTTRNNAYDMVVSIDHPYAYSDGTYQDETSTYRCVSGSTYAIVSDFTGGTKDNLIRRRQKELSQNLADGLAGTSEEVLGETLNVMGLTWLKETGLIDSLMDCVADTIYLRHHAVGLMAQETGYYIDVRTQAYSGASRRQVGSYGDTISFIVAATISSAFEHAILEQLMGVSNPGISTIKLIDIANRQGHKIYWADPAVSASIPLQNYSAQTLDEIQSYIDAGETVILPENGQLGVNQWQGAGYCTKYISSDGTGGAIGMIIGGGYFGGYASTPAQVDSGSVSQNVTKTLPDVSYDITIPTVTSSEPVDMASGAYLSGHTDLSLGAKAPMGLEFSRSYNSSRSGDKRSLGYGWHHNYEILLNKISDANPGLGLGTPVDAAAMITNLYIAEDLIENEDTITGWVTMFLAHKWAADRLIDNAINVDIGGQAAEYIKLPDGTYNNPAGITTRLIDNGNGTFSLRERFGAQMDFDTSGRITQLSDVDGNRLSFTYSGGKLTSVQDAVGRYLDLNYSGDNLSSVVDSEGRSVSYTYDANSDLLSVTDVAGKAWGYVYDAEHRLTSLSNPLGITTVTNTYDTLGRVKIQTVPRDGVSTNYNFYFSGFRNVEEDPFGRRTVYYLDKKGRTYAAQDQLGNKAVKTFDGQNQVLTIKDARQNITTFGYDGNQNLIKTTDALGKETENSYDAQLRLTGTADPLDHATHYDYDAKHHLIRTTDALGNVIGSTYYSNGQIESITDARGTLTTHTYDGNKNPSSTQTASHPAILYSYDRLGRRLGLTDQEGSTTSFTYDNRGLLLTRTDSLGSQTSYVYDDAGRMTRRTDRNNNAIDYTSTPSDKLKTITYPDASTVTFTYDQHDRLIRMRDALGTTAYVYDEVNRIKSVTNPYGQVVSYEYDMAGNVTKITYPGNKAVTYTYDALNRLKTVSDWQSHIATYNYDDAGRLTSIVNFNSTQTTYGYDNANRLLSLQSKTSSAGVTISGYTYTLDVNGNRIAVTQREPLAPVVPSGSADFTYNTTKNRLLSAGSTNFTYDDEGQLATKGAANYGFDYEHRLVSISGAQPSQFFYDGKGNRLKAVRNGTETRYIYDASGNLLAETNGSNAVLRYYIYGRGLLAMVKSNGETYTYHYNGIGSTIAMTDQNKGIINKYSYSPFGVLTNQQEGASQPFKYAGQYGVMQEPNGLYYMRARYYDPSIGRFISEDPLGLDAGVNLYVYCNNNPINYIDPLGLDTYYVNYELNNPNPSPTNSAISHSYIVITDNGIVTDTYSWGNNAESRWFHDDPRDMQVAQRAIDAGVGIRRYGGEDLDPYVTMQFQNRQSDTSIYNLAINNCKQNAGNLLKDAQRQQRSNQQSGK